MKLACIFALAVITLQAQPAGRSKPGAAPRTADGHPDLQGIWTNATLTPLARPAQQADRATLTAEEALALEKRAAAVATTDARGATAEQDRDLAYNRLFIDRGSELAVVDGQKRSSLIVDPADGRVPALTAAARAKRAARLREMETFSGASVRPLGERCLVGFGSTSGPPMMPVLYNNNYQIVQTADAIMILVEMVHDVRTIRMNGSPHPPATVKLWLGDSIGHWESNTLVVDTTNFTGKTSFQGSGDGLRVVERFRMQDAETFIYRVTVEDPASFAGPMTVEYPFRMTAGPIFEYACHEGNYAMSDILGGARKQEAPGTERKNQ